MTDRTLPASVKARALHALAVINDWNAAVLRARQMEIIAGCIGRYEYDLIDDPRWGLKNLAEDTLAMIEAEAGNVGWTPAAFYHALGQPKATVLPQSNRVLDWRGAGPR